jgi:hypothetical protein
MSTLCLIVLQPIIKAFAKVEIIIILFYCKKSRNEEVRTGIEI